MAVGRIHTTRHAARVAAISTLALTATLLTAIPAHAANPEPVLVPSLREWTGGTGTLTLTTATRIVVDPADAGAATSGVTGPLLSTRTLSEVATEVRDDFAAVTGLSPTVVTSATANPGDIVLRLDPDVALGTEGYQLTVGSTATLSAPTSTGVYYGGRTLAQLLRLDPAHTGLPAGTARDWPSLAYRAEHFDVSRRYMSVAEITDEIRRMSWNKLNVLQLMFNQANAFRLYHPSYAAAAPTDPAQRYSQADINTILQVAAEHHVTVVPEIQNPTKMAPVAGLGGVDRSLNSQCGDPQTLDFTDPAVVTWMQQIVTTFAAWFPATYIHLGNDEVPAALATCPYLQAKMTGGLTTLADLQEVYIEQLRQTVVGLGKKAMIWVNNADIQPAADVLIMNFGSTSVSSTMRSLGYDVVESSYKTGPYDRFYISPADYESKVVARGEMYAWTPVAHARNAGQVLAAWGDDLFFSETGYYLDMFDGRRSELAERTWSADPATLTFAQFTAAVAALGDAPGATPRTHPAATTNAQPIHRYTYNAAYTPTAATHYPGHWQLSIADTVGTLHGNGWLYRPTYPATGRTGNGLQFTAGTSQTLSLGGRAIPGPWTFSTWIKRTADSTNTVLIRDMEQAIKVEENGSNHQVGITRYGVGNHPFTYALPLNQWVHLTMVGTTTGTSLYADGVFQQTIPQTIALPLGGLGGKRPFSGVLDDTAVYRQALTAGQVSDLYAAAVGNDLALGRPVIVSSTYRVGVEAVNAVDGDSATRWSSDRSDPQWIYVDLGSTRTVNRVRINWEAAYGKSYEIQVSDDAVNWTPIYSTTTGDGGVDDLTGLSGTGRYVRMYGTQRGTVYGYSIWDFNVFGA
ncbi:family 20 glycosylhydrolase [Catellatospora sp. NPDC049609]|uniref:family 20 glycosylhydrolase n=1 Tax=Catellatospora sp. NPDC049609 TaxID=3155505 RepID=UPI003447711D